MDRLSWLFASPNVAGLIFLQFSLFFLLIRVAASSPKIITVLLFFVASSFGILLAFTQSRAALLALIICMFISAFRKDIGIKKSALFLLVVAIAWLLVSGMSRFNHTNLSNTADPRFLLWQGSLALGWHQPAIGFGDEAQNLLNCWFLPTDLSQRFTTPLNDTLNFYIRFGMIGIFIYFLIIAYVAYPVFIWKKNHAIQMAVAYVFIAYFICSHFQAHFTYLENKVVLLSSLLILASLNILKLFQYRFRDYSYMVVASLIGCAIIACLSHYAYSKSDVKNIEFVRKNDIEKKSLVIAAESPSDINKLCVNWKHQLNKNQVRVQLIECPPSHLKELNTTHQYAILMAGPLGTQALNLCELGKSFGQFLIIDEPLDAPIAPSNNQEPNTQILILSRDLMLAKELKDYYSQDGDLVTVKYLNSYEKIDFPTLKLPSKEEN